MPIAVLDEDYKKADQALTWVPTALGVAIAIAAERERCAQIAEKFNAAGKPIAKAIRGIS